jgi:hypothetical protein
MKLNKSLGMLLLAVYLILVGLTAIFRLSFSGMEIIEGICALGAGILLLINR